MCYALEGLAHALWPLVLVITAALLTRVEKAGRDTNARISTICKQSGPMQFGRRLVCRHRLWLCLIHGGALGQRSQLARSGRMALLCFGAAAALV